MQFNFLNDSIIKNCKLHNPLRSILNMFIDTEYCQKEKMETYAIGIYCSELSNNAILFDRKDIDNNFNPFINTFNSVGFKSKAFDDNMDEIFELTDDLSCNYFGDNNKENKKIFNDSIIKLPEINDICERLGINHNDISYAPISKKDNASLFFELPTIYINLIAHYLSADLFKIFGKNHQYLIKENRISKYRNLKIMNNGGFITTFIEIDNKVYEFKIKLLDTINRIPPAIKSLDFQAKTFGCSTSKIDLPSIVAPILGMDKSAIMSNMDIVATNLKTYPLMMKYLAYDLKTTHDLHNKQLELIDNIFNDLNLANPEMKETAGSNVSNIIKNLIYSYFKIDLENVNKVKEINKIISLSNINNLQDNEFNHFGYQPFLVNGGLLFSRVCKQPIIEGYLGDIDGAGFYSNQISKMNLYLGEPIINSFKNKNRPTLKDIYKIVSDNKFDKDSWYCRVSGDIEKFLNTLIYSDLKFTPNKKLIPKNNGFSNENKKVIYNFNIEKTGKKQALSTLLLNEIKFGIITQDTIDIINLLPTKYQENFYNLKIDFFTYYEPSLICNSLDDYYKKIESLPESGLVETINNKSYSWNLVLAKKNVSLKFPIKDSWKLMVEIRKQRKITKNTIQQVYKLILNAGYGALACIHLPVNNPIGANVITSSCRASAWMLMYAMNGFQIITDGCTFNWKNIPLGYKFNDLIKDNHDYLINHNPNICNDLNIEKIPNRQKWIDNNLKKHLADFFNISEDNYLIQKFNYELKTEIFIDKNDNEVESDLFTKFYNTNSGNYIKSMNDCKILFEGYEYEFFSQSNKIKARSYKSNNSKQIEWYIYCLENGYKLPHIYEEKSIINFSEGNEIVINTLENNESLESTVHPMGFNITKYKSMRLISRSQFLFKTERQLNNFLTNEEKLAKLSKYHIAKPDKNDSKYADYEYSMRKPSGTGFEILNYNKAYTSLKDVRCKVQELIMSDCTNFNTALNIDRDLIKKSQSNAIKNILPVLKNIISLKKEAESKLLNVLKSSDCPNLLSINRDEIGTIESWLINQNDEM